MSIETTQNDRVKYYSQNLQQLWSFDAYNNYKKAVWRWDAMPFDNDFLRPNKRTKSFVLTNPVTGKSIVEIGAAMGGGYAFLKKSGIVDVSDYTGIEISDMGHTTSKELYPQAKWIQADFTKYQFEKKYDYAYERHAVHHMPDPIAQFKKILNNVNVAMSMTFVSCSEGETISDLEKGHYKNADKGLAYFDIINIFELVKTALDEDFNHIRVVYWGDHEPIPNPIDPPDHQYLAPEVKVSHNIGRCCVRAARCLGLKQPLIYVVPGNWKIRLKCHGNLSRIRTGLNSIP